MFPQLVLLTDFLRVFATRCYNAGHHWILNWYPAARQSYASAPSTPVLWTIIAFVDYTRRQGNDKVLVQVGDHYFQYNKAKGHNAGTLAMPDQLVIVQKNSDQKTTVRAGLNLNSNPYTLSGRLQVRVCRAYQRANGVDVMEVSVGRSSTNCGSGSVRGSGASSNSGSWSNRASNYGGSSTSNNNSLRFVTIGTRTSSSTTNANSNNKMSQWYGKGSLGATTEQEKEEGDKPPQKRLRWQSLSW